MTQPTAAAIDAAMRAQTKWKVPASVQLAQWADESGWGAHAPGNNPFGMKPRLGIHDPCKTYATTEWNPGLKQYEATEHTFRIFPSIAAAFDAHAELLATAPVYAPAMAALPDLNLFIQRMAAHYASDPRYAAKLAAIIRGSNLTTYDA